MYCKLRHKLRTFKFSSLVLVSIVSSQPSAPALYRLKISCKQVSIAAAARCAYAHAQSCPKACCITNYAWLFTQAHRLTGAVVTDGFVLGAIDLHDGVKDLSYGVSPAIEDALVKARYGGRRHCGKRYTIAMNRVTGDSGQQIMLRLFAPTMH